MTAATGRVDESRDVPPWLQPVAEAAGSIRGTQLSRYLPPRNTDPRPASVLMLFGDSSGQPDVLLIERAHDMRSHAGQVAFPGGAQDPQDADAVSAALREAAEETGLDPTGVDVVGVLPTLWLPPSNFAVTPVLGWWRTPSPVGAADIPETASVLTVPIAELVDPANRVTVRHPSGFLGPAFLVRDLVVWGLTAGLLSRLFAIVGWEQRWDEEHVIELPDSEATSSMRDLERAVQAGHLPATAMPLTSSHSTPSPPSLAGADGEDAQ